MGRVYTREEMALLLRPQLSTELAELYSQVHVLKVTHVPGANARMYVQVICRELNGIGMIRYQYNFSADVVELPRLLVEIAPKTLYWDCEKPPKWLTDIPGWNRTLGSIEFVEES